jgi:cytochrome b
MKCRLFGASEYKEALEEVYEFFASFNLFLVVVHVAGVILGGIYHGKNLVRAIFTGTKQSRLRVKSNDSTARKRR